MSETRNKEATDTFQPWFCERCGITGIMRIAPHEGVFSVMSRLAQAHELLTTECNFTSYLRVSNPAFNLTPPRRKRGPRT